LGTILPPQEAATNAILGASTSTASEVPSCTNPETLDSSAHDSLELSQHLSPGSDTLTNLLSMALEKSATYEMGSYPRVNGQNYEPPHTIFPAEVCRAVRISVWRLKP
jgi:hypothetical protein